MKKEETIDWENLVKVCDYCAVKENPIKLEDCLFYKKRKGWTPCAFFYRMLLRSDRNVYILKVSGGEWEDAYELTFGVFSTYKKAYKIAVKYSGGKLEQIDKNQFLAKNTGMYEEDEILEIEERGIDKVLYEM